MSNFVESILVIIADIVIFLMDSFKKGEITLYENITHQPFSYRSFKIVIPVVALGLRKERISETDEEYLQLYFGNKLSIIRNKELGYFQLRLCVMGFGFQIVRQLDY